MTKTRFCNDSLALAEEDTGEVGKSVPKSGFCFEKLFIRANATLEGEVF